MKILKFGGSSVSTPERIKKVIEIIANSRQEDKPIAVVFSAFGGVTDELIEMSQKAALCDDCYLKQLESLEKRHLDAVKFLIDVRSQSRILAHVKFMMNELEDVLHGVFLIKELTLKTLDFILSFGERLSSFIISESLQQNKIAAEFLDARHIITTDNNFSDANVLPKITEEKIREYFQNHPRLQIVTGFIGATQNNETTTLGRGGSDFTAALLGAALDAHEVEIWTDVDGVMTANPNKVPDAFPLHYMTYEEAMEMSHFGAKVIYPPTIQPVLEKKIPVRIRNTFNTEFPGTLIQDKITQNHDFMLRGLSSVENISILRVQGSGMIGVVGIASRLFSALARGKINVILITQASSEHSICIAVSQNQSQSSKRVVEEEFALEIETHHIDEIVLEEHLAIIAVVGANMRHTPGISGKLFQSLGTNNVNVVAIAQGSSELNISIVVSQKDEAKALNAIHQVYFN